MELSIVKIGNSKGIRIPKVLLEKYNIRDKVELILDKEYIILKSASTPRKGWEKAFEKMNKRGEDKLLFDDVFENEDFEEWN